MAPQLVTLVMYDRHWSAGDRFETSVFVINNLYKAHEKNMVVELSLLSAKGRKLHEERISFPDVP